ncbi:MAG TPA: prenyltransferase [Thermoplasmata archaeon]|nr:prenyltransferase [Thermoplasmata archaeon]
MASLRTWVKATQPHSFVASAVGVFLGTAIAYARRGVFDAPTFLLTLLGVVALQAATNMSNDTVDFLHGVDDLPPHLVSPFTGGARVLPDGQLTVHAHRRAWIALYAVGGAVGLLLAGTRPNGWILLVLGLLGGALGAFYTLPPFSLQYHGLGDVAVGLVFGPIVTLGAFAVQTGSLSLEALLASLPLGILVAAFLFVNEMPEHETDPRGGKRTIPARLGLERSYQVYVALITAAVVLLVAFVATGGMPWLALLGLLAVPPLLRSVRVLRAYYREYPRHMPANAGTIQAVLLLGIGLTAAYALLPWL